MTNPTPPRSRRGEDKPRLILFFFIIITLTALISIIVGVVLLASTNTRQVVLKDQQDVGIYDARVVSAPFSILSVRYVDVEDASCALGTEFQRPATLTLRFQTQLTPDSCSVFVNGALLFSERRLDADCGLNCPFSEFNRQFSLRYNDYRDDHQIRVCCNDICVERTLQNLCNTAMQ